MKFSKYSIGFATVILLASAFLILGTLIKGKQDVTPKTWEALTAAAAMAGMDSGNSLVCGYDDKPVLSIWGDILKKFDLTKEQNDELTKTWAAGVAMVSGVKEKGQVSLRKETTSNCEQLKVQHEKTLDTLNQFDAKL